VIAIIAAMKRDKRVFSRRSRSIVVIVIVVVEMLIGNVESWCWVFIERGFDESVRCEWTCSLWLGGVTLRGRLSLWFWYGCCLFFYFFILCKKLKYKVLTNKIK
jgi:hypothetical protein